MRLTSSFAVFRFDPGEKDLAKARWFGREGKLDAAEQEYRAALAKNPDLKAGWLELFELQRRASRFGDALDTASRAQAHFGADAAMPLAMRGAALAEMGQTRDAIQALEGALERDGNLALAWHELAYAAFRTGEYSRALLALDRAFALEPHTDTLMLRGRILREAGQYDAAEVAFEAAQQSAEHDIPRRDAEREILATRRAAALGGKRPRDFSYRERWFVALGCAVLDDGLAQLGAAEAGGTDPARELARCLAALPDLARALAWRPAAVAGVAPEDGPLVEAVARALDAQAVAVRALDPDDRPLIVTGVATHGGEWSKQLARLARWKSGYTFALLQPPGPDDVGDVVGTLRGPRDPATAGALACAAVALASQVEPADVAEAASLASSPASLWQRRNETAR
jgi:tetratricopeptide (TPR) repeat protein